MIGPDDYPVYNHPDRPGIGRDHHGETHFNCFSISLERDDSGSYLPYTFSDFIGQYNAYGKHAGTCEACIEHAAVRTYPALHETLRGWERTEVDPTRVAAKFDWDMADSEFNYCPLVHEALQSSDVRAQYCPESQGGAPAEPMTAIFSGGGDNEYLFEFDRVGRPENMRVCPIYRRVTSDAFVSRGAEQAFLELWLTSIFERMDHLREAGREIYLEYADFKIEQSKLLAFVFPVPQVWVWVIPKPPPGADWRKWEQEQQARSLPQRVDFLFTYRGKRHVVELDDRRHYAEQQGGMWVPSETAYRATLTSTRWLRRCGYEVHRFTNAEVLELWSDGSPDIEGFVRLLESEGLDATELVLQERACPDAG